MGAPFVGLPVLNYSFHFASAVDRSGYRGREIFLSYCHGIEVPFVGYLELFNVLLNVLLEAFHVHLFGVQAVGYLWL